MANTSNANIDPFEKTIRVSIGKPAPAPEKIRRFTRDPNDPCVRAQSERVRAIKSVTFPQEGNPDALPSLPRIGRAGPHQFSAVGVRDVVRRRVDLAAVSEAQQDVSFMLEAAYRPGFENVVLTSWVRFVGNDVTPMLYPGQTYAPGELGLIRVGYTGCRINDLAGVQRLPQAVLVVHRIDMTDGVPTTTPCQLYDLTRRDSSDTGDAPRKVDSRRTPVLAGLSTFLGFHLADTVRRHENPAGVWYGGHSVAAHGPLMTVAVEGDERGPTGAPTEMTYVVYSMLNATTDGRREFRDQPDEIRLSFSHLGPVATDRDMPSVIGMSPWTITPGHVYDTDDGSGSPRTRWYGDVVVGEWPRDEEAATQDAK